MAKQRNENSRKSSSHGTYRAKRKPNSPKNKRN